MSLIFLGPKEFFDINTNINILMVWVTHNVGFCRSGADGGERYQRQRQHPSAPRARPRYSGRLSRLTSTFYNNFCIINNQRGRTFLLSIAIVVNFVHTIIYSIVVWKREKNITTETEFLDEIQTKVLRVFHHAIQSFENYIASNSRKYFFKLGQHLKYFYIKVTCTM
jgi:hypothetical protein